MIRIDMWWRGVVVDDLAVIDAAASAENDTRERGERCKFGAEEASSVPTWVSYPHRIGTVQGFLTQTVWLQGWAWRAPSITMHATETVYGLWNSALSRAVEPPSSRCSRSPYPPPYETMERFRLQAQGNCYLWWFKATNLGYESYVEPINTNEHIMHEANKKITHQNLLSIKRLKFDTRSCQRFLCSEILLIGCVKVALRLSWTAEI